MISSEASRRTNYLFILLIILTGISIYIPSINIEFVNDEIAFISRNKADSISELAGLFDKKDYDGDYYRPLANLTTGLITLAGGYEVWVYRVFNLLLHTANGVLVYLFILLLMRGKEKDMLTALFGSLFFLAFPLNDYAVIWHTALFDRLMMLFYLLSMIYFLRENKPGAVSVIFFLLAALSKEMAFSLPLVIFFLAPHSKSGAAKALKASLPYIIILAGLLFFRWIIFSNNIFSLQDAHSQSGLQDIFRNYILFGGMLVFPFFLRETQELLAAHSGLLLIAGVTAFIIAVFLIYKYRRKDYLFFTIIILLLITILPASRLLMRWYLYLPSAFFCTLLAYLIFSSRINIRASLTAALLVFTLYYSYLLYRETRWIEISAGGKYAVNNLINENKEDIYKAAGITFLTVPAKVDDIPLFQLGFDHHLNHYLESFREISVLSRSYLSGINDMIGSEDDKGEFNLTHTGDNYFILSGIEKSIKFNSKDFQKGKLKHIQYKNGKDPLRIIFTFSEGNFYRIKGN